MDTIRIANLELACIVGIRPAERRRRQQVCLSLELDLDLSHAGKSGRIAQTVDYSVVADAIGALLQFREYRLIEMATEEIASMLLGLYPALERVRVTLEKPEALRGRAAHSAVSIERAQSEPRISQRRYGEEQLLLETSEAKLRLLRVRPGERLEPPADRGTRTLGWLVSGHLTADRALAQHEPNELSRLLEAENRGTGEAVVFLCCCVV